MEAEQPVDLLDGRVNYLVSVAAEVVRGGGGVRSVADAKAIEVEDYALPLDVGQLAGAGVL